MHTIVERKKHSITVANIPLSISLDTRKEGKNKIIHKIPIQDFLMNKISGESLQQQKMFHTSSKCLKRKKFVFNKNFLPLVMFPFLLLSDDGSNNRKILLLLLREKDGRASYQIRISC